LTVISASILTCLRRREKRAENHAGGRGFTLDRFRVLFWSFFSENQTEKTPQNHVEISLKSPTWNPLLESRCRSSSLLVFCASPRPCCSLISSRWMCFWTATHTRIWNGLNCFSGYDKLILYFLASRCEMMRFKAARFVDCRLHRDTMTRN